MDDRKIKNEYMKWIRQLINSNNHHICSQYKKLLNALDAVHFSYSIDMDGNRYEDGISLRYRFGYEKGYDDGLIATTLDVRPCSVLEMMVALALRCEEQIIIDTSKGLNTGRLFWDMVDNLGLFDMDDEYYDEELVEEIINIFLSRKYEWFGEGNIFRFDPNWLECYGRDIRKMEIWYQMCLYLDYKTRRC